MNEFEGSVICTLRLGPVRRYAEMPYERRRSEGRRWVLVASRVVAMYCAENGMPEIDAHGLSSTLGQVPLRSAARQTCSHEDGERLRSGVEEAFSATSPMGRAQ